MKHLLIDFENIQPQNLDKLPNEDTHIWLFLGTQHKSLSISLVESLLPFDERVHLIHLQKSGKNALDFYLSYYLGKITSTDPDAQIGILSRDGGYDILVDHILEKQEAKGVVRLANIDEVQHTKINTKPPTKLPEPHPQPENSLTPPQSLALYFQATLTALRQPNAFLPSCLHNLQQNLYKYILREQLQGKTDEECETTIAQIIHRLKSQNFISVDAQGIVIYHISDDDLLQKIERYILNTKPKTFTDFQAAVKKRAGALSLSVNEVDIQALARHLREQNHIRQKKGKIEYAPFSSL